MTKMAKFSQNWLDVLVPFSYEYNKKFSGTEISKKTGIPQRSVSRYLTSLINKNLIRFELKGNNKLYYFDLENPKSRIVMDFVENYKSFKFSLNSFIWKEIECFLDFGTIVLFGSRIKKNYNSSSDLDLIIFANKSRKLLNALRKFPKIHAQIISFGNFEKLVLRKDVLSLEILNNHVIFGNKDKFIDLCWSFYNR